MNPQQAEKLRVLIRHMETNVARALNMHAFTNRCGTPACALGEACTLPALQVQGLRAATYTCYSLGYPPQFNGTSDDRGELFFGLSRDHGNAIFGNARSNVWKRDDVTPHEWAAEARKVLAENGYAMDDPFKRFMDKVREPVSLGSYALTPR